MKAEAAAAPVYVDRGEREDREDEMPTVVDAEEATVSSKKRHPPAEAPHGGAQSRGEPAQPESAHDRFREKPLLVAMDEALETSAAEADTAKPIVFQQAKKKSKGGAQPSGSAPRARRLDNQQLLSFDDDTI